jgi:cell division protein FtsI (penicillin-binding protein 3)
VIDKPIEGKNITLSLDSHIQYLAFRTLQDAVATSHAKSGSVVVLDVKTGEILAMVNMPDYNPNSRVRDVGQYRNRAVTDPFEPGSVMKAFSVASALNSGKYTPTTKIDTSPGWTVIDKHMIRDDSNNGVVTVTQVLQKSSNVGVLKMTLSLPPENLFDLLQKVGFGERTGSALPGEAAGALSKRKIWRPTDLATFAFGYGLSVTTLQLAHAYSIIANDGVSLPVSILKLNAPPEGERVMRSVIADQMLAMLKTVLEPGGSGMAARVAGYQVAGKTGTAYTAGGPTGYDRHRYNASFVGIAPASRPRLVVAVVVHELTGYLHFGGEIAAPAFAKIMSGSLQYLNIAPDDLGSKIKTESK